MITAHLTRCMLVNPYDTPSGTPDEWAGWVAKRFFGEEPGGSNVLIFGVACTVGSIVGYLVQQFIIGTGIGKALGKLKDSGKFAELAGKLGIKTKALTKTTSATQKAAKATEKGLMRGTAEAATEALEKTGLKWGDDAATGFAYRAAKYGCAGGCELFVKQFVEEMGEKTFKTLDEWLQAVPSHLRSKVDNLMNSARRGNLGAQGELRWLEKNFNDVADIKFLDGPTGRKLDALLKDNTIVEVKTWRSGSLHNPGIQNLRAGGVAKQLERYYDISLGHNWGGKLKLVFVERVPEGLINAIQNRLPWPVDIVNGL